MRTVLVLLIALVALAGCGGGERAAEADGPIRLVYWTSQNPQERTVADTLVARWNRTHPDVQVAVQPIPAGQSSEEVLLASIVAGTTPDICSNIAPSALHDMVRAGGLVPLDGLPGFDSLMAARVPPELVERFRSADGRFYQLPWKTNPILMMVNPEMLRDAGVARVPRTYSEYLAAAERVTADTDGDGRNDRWMGTRDIRPIWWQRTFDVYPLYVAASGGRTLFDAEGDLAIDNEAMSDVLGFFQTLYARGDYPRSTLQGNAFAQGRVATDFTGPWTIGWLAENAPDLAVDFAPVPVPDGTPLDDGPPVTYGDYKNIALFATTRHPEAAWAFAQYLVSPQADRMLIETTRQIPIRSGLLDDPQLAPFFATYPSMRRFAEQAAATRGVDAVPDLPETLDAVAQGYERVIYGVESPVQAVQSITERIGVLRAWAE
ncbi:ABC transporter substrate-binding protein [Rubrivirga sp.]|uniref:ABC transporter substrate-binding protein n=1 Tax=Rubrivirga sp. TaxID=1885344 RepID=UPI003B52F34D